MVGGGGDIRGCDGADGADVGDKRHDTAEWKALVKEMIDRGAEVSDRHRPQTTAVRPVAAHRRPS
jgi:hypothetical protein